MFVHKHFRKRDSLHLASGLCIICDHYIPEGFQLKFHQTLHLDAILIYTVTQRLSSQYLKETLEN